MEKQHPEDSAQFSEEETTDERLPLIEVESIINRPPSPRKRLVELGLAFMAGAVTLAVFWGVFFPKAPAPPAPYVRPTEALPTLLITSNVGYGTVTINGVVQRGSLPLTVTMHTQPPYTIILNAPPFRPGYCQIGDSNAARLPPNVGGSCIQSGGFVDDDGKKPGVFLQINFSLDDLPPEQQSQVAALFPHAATFGKDVPIPARSYIVTSVTPAGAIGFQRTNEALQGTATFAPRLPFNEPAYACQDYICVNAGPGDFSALPRDAWKIYVPMSLTWHFVNPTGEVVSDVTLPFADLVTLFLAYDQAQGWHLTSVSGSVSTDDQLAGLACSTGATVLQLQVLRQSSNEGWDISVLVGHGAEGRMLGLLHNSVVMGHFLWRFAVIMAADDQAHATLPSLPVAPPEEIAAVSGA